MRMHRSLETYGGSWHKNDQQTDANVTFLLQRPHRSASTVSVALEAEHPTGFDRRITAEMTPSQLVALRNELDAIIETAGADAPARTHPPR